MGKKLFVGNLGLRQVAVRIARGETVPGGAPAVERESRAASVWAGREVRQVPLTAD